MPMRSLGPCRSCRIPTGEPNFIDNSLVLIITARWSPCEPCEKFNRTIFMPA